LNARRIAMRWGGYNPGDSRLAEGTYPLDQTRCLAPQDYQVAFPDILALRNPETKQTTYQRLAGQVAPGLSPREIQFYPWKSAEGGPQTIFDHPYGRIANIRANQDGLVSVGSLASLAPFESDVPGQNNFDLNVEERFTLGLSGYREVPLVPPGFGYPDGTLGKPRKNLNEWMRRVELDPSEEKRKEVVGEMAAYIKQMLPLFESRKGAFPEDYVKTLAASMIDYADRDSMSTVMNPTFNLPYNPDQDKDSYRGIDNFPLVNEFFVKIALRRTVPEGGGERHSALLPDHSVRGTVESYQRPGGRGRPQDELLLPRPLRRRGQRSRRRRRPNGLRLATRSQWGPSQW